MDNIIRPVVDVFMYVFEMLLLWYYANTAFEAKRSKPVCLLAAFAVNAVLFVFYHLSIPFLNASLVLILYTLFIVLLYKASVKTAIFHSVIFVVIMLGSEIVVMGLGSWLFEDFAALNEDNNNLAYVYTIVTSKIIYFVIMMFILKVFIKRKSAETENKYYWFLSLMPLSSVAMILSFVNVAYNMKIGFKYSFWWILSAILVLFANIIIFMLYEYSNKNTKELYELKAAAKQEEEDRKYFEIIEQSDNEMRVFAHDMKNHLSQLRNIDNVEDMHSYIDSLGKNIDSFYYVGMSKNKTLDLIIGKYMKLCQANGIKFIVDVKTSNLGYMDSVDLSTLFNNLLDNSLEAAKDSENAFISLTAFAKNQAYDGVIIKNSCRVAPEIKDGKLITTKNDKKLHGIGLTGINKIVKKYNAVYDWKYDGQTKTFETDIAIKKGS